MKGLLNIFSGLYKTPVRYWINWSQIGFHAANVSTYAFSTLYTTLPHNLIEETLIDLIKELFKENDRFTLRLMTEVLPSRLKNRKCTHYGLVKRCVKPG